MKINLYRDNNMDIDLSQMLLEINKRMSLFELNDAGDFNIDGHFIEKATYEKISDEINGYCIVITNKPYINNYFIDNFGLNTNIIIISFYNWYYYTSIPKNNGFLFFFIALLGEYYFLINNRNVPECNQKACFFNKLMDKREIDLVMRVGEICPNCQSSINFFPTEVKATLKSLLNDLSEASKWNIDIIDYWSKSNIQISSNKFSPKNTDGLSINEALIKDINDKYKELEDCETNKKGRVFEEFVSLLFSQIQGWELLSNNHRNHTAEIDLIFNTENNSKTSLQNLFVNFIVGNLVYVECKNTKRKAGAGVVRNFIGTFRGNPAVGIGILFSFNGITGYEEENLLKRKDGFGVVYDEFHKNQILTLLMDKKDIEKLKNGENIITLLRQKYWEIAIEYRLQSDK